MASSKIPSDRFRRSLSFASSLPWIRGRQIRFGGALPLLLAIAWPALLAGAYIVRGAAGGIALLVLPLLVLLVVRSSNDVVTLLSVMLVLLCAVPERFRVGALGSAGTPATMLGVLAFGVWVFRRVRRPPAIGAGPGRPVQVPAGLFIGAVVLSYAAAHLRPLDLVESRAADRGLLTIVSAVGIMLLAADGVSSEARLHTLITRIVWGVAGIASLAVIQYAFGVDLAAKIRIPGLASSGDAFTGSRSGFARIASTTAHPIEFSVVLAMTLPIAVYLALSGHQPVVRRWLPVVLIAAGLPMSVSRTAAVGFCGAAVVLFWWWDWRRRLRALAATAVFLVGMRLVIPGLLGTLTALFTSSGNDPSVVSRQENLGLAWAEFYRHPLFGRGISTFIPTRYSFTDNQYLLSLVETGVVGTVAFALLLIAGLRLGWLLHRLSDHPQLREFGQYLAAAVVVAAACSATYDFLGFATGRSLFFLLLGCGGAAWRMSGQLSKRDLDELSRPVGFAGVGQ